MALVKYRPPVETPDSKDWKDYLGDGLEIGGMVIGGVIGGMAGNAPGAVAGAGLGHSAGQMAASFLEDDPTKSKKELRQGAIGLFKGAPAMVAAYEGAKVPELPGEAGGVGAWSLRPPFPLRPQSTYINADPNTLANPFGSSFMGGAAKPLTLQGQPKPVVAAFAEQLDYSTDEPYGTWKPINNYYGGDLSLRGKGFGL